MGIPLRLLLIEDSEDDAQLLLRELRRGGYEPRFERDETLYAERSLRAGARGYAMKDESPQNVLAAIRKVLSGALYVSDRMSARLLQQAISGHPGESGGSIERLGDRELEVLELIGRGLGTRQIANQLHLSVKTIESHRAHIKEKLGLKSASELTLYAVRWVHDRVTS